MAGTSDEQFEAWRRQFTKAKEQWTRLVPSGIIGAGGAMYRVRILDRPTYADGTQVSEEEWKALGWTFRDGVRSTHPEPKVDSDLWKASLALAEVCRSFRPDFLEGDAGAAKRLGYALASATELLEGSRDPVTKACEEAVGRVESEALEIVMQRARIRRQLEEEERKRQEKEEDFRKIAAELSRLNAAEEERAADEEKVQAVAGDTGAQNILSHFRKNGNTSVKSEDLFTISRVSRRKTQELVRLMRPRCERCQKQKAPCGDHVGLLELETGKRRGWYRASALGIKKAKEQAASAAGGA